VATVALDGEGRCGNEEATKTPEGALRDSEERNVELGEPASAPAYGVGAEANHRRPVPRPRLVVRSLRRDPIGVFAALEQEQGDLAQVRFGRNEFFLVSHPDLIKRVLVSHERDYVREAYAYKSWRRPRFERPSGLLQPHSDADAHLRARRALQPLFRRSEVDAHWSDLVAIARAESATWRDGTTIDFVAQISNLVLPLVSLVPFGRRADLPINELVTNLRICVGSMVDVTSARHELASRLRLRRMTRLAEARERIFDVLTPILAEARVEPGGRGLPDTLVGLAESEGLDEHALLLEAYGHLVNSPDTSISALCWILYVLAEHPATRTRLQEELDTAATSGRDGPLPADLPFTRAVIAETLRLHPPTWRLKRRALVDHELAGRKVRAGDHVWISPPIVHRDQRWWPDADRFLPERWLEMRGRPEPFTYIPFGAGPRKCLGEQIAWRELTAILLAVLERWELSLAPGTKLVPHAGTTFRPRGDIYVRIRQRDCAA
jgi:cytochrome P450